MRAASDLDHGLSDPTLLTKPVLTLSIEVGDAVLGEEFCGDPVLRRLFGGRFGAVFTEFGPMSMPGVGIGPSAAHAVETFSLIELQ